MVRFLPDSKIFSETIFSYLTKTSLKKLSLSSLDCHFQCRFTDSILSFGGKDRNLFVSKYNLFFSVFFTSYSRL